jgi:hypothetical protein
MIVNRRESFKLIFIGGFGFMLVSCVSSKSPVEPAPLPAAPSPTQNFSDLLSRVKAQGYDAVRVPFGNNGAARIAIRGDINWNFLVNDITYGLGSGSAPTLDVPALVISDSARVAVRSF